MNKFLTAFTTICFSLSSVSYAADAIWSKQLNSNGTPSEIVKLNLGDTYKLKVSGTMNLGKWRTNKQPLENDACYEFFADPAFQNDMKPKKIDAFKNSLNIIVCDGEYHPNHIYESKPFVATQNGIHFWVEDIDYEDNSGALDVEIIQVSKGKSE